MDDGVLLMNMTINGGETILLVDPNDKMEQRWFLDVREYDCELKLRFADSINQPDSENGFISFTLPIEFVVFLGLLDPTLAPNNEVLLKYSEVAETITVDEFDCWLEDMNSKMVLSLSDGNISCKPDISLLDSDE